MCQDYETLRIYSSLVVNAVLTPYINTSSFARRFARRKDERGSNDFDTDNKAVRHVSSDSPLGPFNPDNISDLLSPTLTEGPSAFIVPCPGDGEAPFRMYYDCFMNGRYGVSESYSLDKGWTSVGESSCESFGTSVEFPDDTRHGSVVCVTNVELENLKNYYN